MRLWFRLLISCLVILVLVGCGQASQLEGKGETLPTPTINPTPTVELTDTPAATVQDDSPDEEVEAMPIDPALQPLVQQAKEDLAGRLNVPLEEIELVSAELVVWPDASLGCPQPDMVYMQVPQDGARIQLTFDDRIFDYHSGGMRDLFLCEQTIKVKPTSPKIDFLKRTPPPRDTGDQ